MGLFDLPSARLAALEARVAALEGATVTAPPEPPSVPADALPLSVGLGLRSGKTYTGSLVGRAGYADKYGAWCEGIADSRVICAGANLFAFGLALRSSSRLAVLGLTAHGCRIPLYASGLVDSELSWLDLDSDSTLSTDHAVYLAQGCQNLRGHDWRLRASAGYALHLYCEQGASSGLTVQGLYLDARSGQYPAVLHNWSGVQLADVESHSARAHYNLWDCSDVLIEDFRAEGGTALVQLAAGRTARNVVFRNGSFAGPRLTGDGKPIPGVAFENVRLI